MDRQERAETQIEFLPDCTISENGITQVLRDFQDFGVPVVHWDRG